MKYLKNIFDYILEFKNSLIKCQENCLILKNEFAEIHKKLLKGEEAPPNLVTDKIINTLGDLDNEPAYTHLLNIFNEKYLFITEVAMYTHVHIASRLCTHKCT